MADLRLVLFGGFDAILPSGVRVSLTARKAQALLAYCALRPGSHLRETLATLLWGETQDERARNSLRQTVFVLRTALAGTFSRVLRVEPESIATDPLGLEVDVRAFERLATEGGPQALERAAALYRGDLLEGFVLDEEPFEQWVMQERERLRDLAMEVLARLFRHQCSSGEAEGAIQTARRLLALDPLQETVHRALMRLLCQTGRREAARRQYDACVDLLRRELRLEPEPETRQLYEAVSRGGNVSPMTFPPEAALQSAASRPMLLTRTNLFQPVDRKQRIFSNEEHETMNEELQATNEELETLNEQLRGRTEELNQANALLESVLAGLSSAAVVVDRYLNVLTWNPRAEDLWGLRRDEVRGRSLVQLDIGLPVGQLIEPLRACLDGDGPREPRALTVDATDRRGRKVSYRITCSPVVSAGQVRGVTLLMDQQS